MKIGGMQKLTLLDFPNKLAAIVFTTGCNFICPFCQNGSLVLGGADEISEKEVFEFLEKRKGILDGVVVSGGEPLVQKDIVSFITKIKELGYLVKLDTNGYEPEKLQELIDKNLLDYIAMDIKNVPTKYSGIVGLENIQINKIKKSVECIKTSKIGYEFRTTMVKPFHEKNDFLEMVRWVGRDSHYFLQGFKDSGELIGNGMKAFTIEEAEEIISQFKDEYPLVELRGY